MLIFEYENEYEYDFICALHSHGMEIGNIYFSVLAKIGIAPWQKKMSPLSPAFTINVRSKVTTQQRHMMYLQVTRNRDL